MKPWRERKKQLVNCKKRPSTGYDDRTLIHEGGDSQKGEKKEVEEEEGEGEGDEDEEDEEEKEDEDEEEQEEKGGGGLFCCVFSGP